LVSTALKAIVQVALRACRQSGNKNRIYNILVVENILDKQAPHFSIDVSAAIVRQ
jgi:hypothetical protein